MVQINEPWTAFRDDGEKLEYFRKWELVSPQAKRLRPVMVVDGYLGVPEPCEVVGYTNFGSAVIQIGETFHAINGDYLAELQPAAPKQIPRGMSFVEVLQDYIVLDIETTALRNGGVLEIAAIRYQYGKQIAQYHQMIDPECDIPESITKLTGITQMDVIGAPTIDEAKPAFLDFIQDLPLIGHNIKSFDIPYLQTAMGITIDNPLMDTLPLARMAFELLPRFKLEYLDEVLHLGSEGAHRALHDVETTNALLWACLAPRRYEAFVNKAFLENRVKEEKEKKPKEQPKKNEKQRDPVAEAIEKRAFDLVYPQIKDIIYDEEEKKDILKVAPLDDLTSIYFLKKAVYFQIRLRKKCHYITIDEEFEFFIPPEIDKEKIRKTDGKIRLIMEEPEDILEYVPVLRAVLGVICSRYQEFACCSRYEQCSDAKRCIHPENRFAIGCIYRENLRAGRIFYGKNRNVD